MVNFCSFHLHGINVSDTAIEIDQGCHGKPITKSITASKGRDTPSALGNLVADAWLAATLQSPYQADMAFINPGQLRSSLTVTEASGGGVTYEDLYNVLPFGNTILTLTLTGDQIRLLVSVQPPHLPLVIKEVKPLLASIPQQVRACRFSCSARAAVFQAYPSSRPLGRCR